MESAYPDTSRAATAQSPRRRVSTRARAAVAFCAATSLIAGVASAPAAQSVGQLESRISAAQAEAGSLAADVDAKASALSAAQARAAAAASREAELTSTLAAGRERAAELTDAVAENREELATARERLDRALDVLARRLVAIYKGDTPDAATLILQADGFDDLVTRTEFLRAIENSDARLAARVRSLRAEIAERLAAVEAARAEQESFNDRVAAARSEIAGARAAAEARAGELAAARAEQAKALAALQSRLGGWTKQVQALRAAQRQEASAPAAREEVASWVGDYAIPSAIVKCESGGNYGALNPSSGAGGAYQIMPSTWDAYGGKGKPHEASKGEQDRIASQIWKDSGSSAWVC